MGLLRTLLALAVLAGHLRSGPQFFGDGIMAVECFYIVSGFYMSLVLRSKYRNNLSAFAKARFIRLAPLYWLIASATLLASSINTLLSGNPTGLWYYVATETYPWWAWLLSLTGNFFGFGADWLLLLGETTGKDMSGLLVIAPIWSVAVEISCYALAPFIFRQSLLWLMIAFGAGLIMRMTVLAESDSTTYFWTLYFMPTGLACFILGGLAHRTFELIPAVWLNTRALCNTGWFACIALLLLIMAYSSLGLFKSRDPIFYLLFACGLPLVFASLRSCDWDRKVGDFAYPIYLIHPVLLTHWGSLRDSLPPIAQFYVLTTLTIGLSWLTMRMVDRFIYSRTARYTRSSPESQPSPKCGEPLSP